MRTHEASAPAARTGGAVRPVAPLVERERGTGGRRALQRSALEGRGGAVEAVPSIVEEVIGRSGTPLPAERRARFDAAFGFDFSRVRVHTDARAAESARAVDARAYTVGRHVVFGRGEGLDADGGRLLAHELVHVVQQSAATGLQRRGISRADDRSEREADAIADRVVRTPGPREPCRCGGPGGRSGGCAKCRRGRLDAGRGLVAPREIGAPPPARLQRQRRRGGTAAAAPHLDVRPSVNGEPCACLVFIHNDERNARLTAQLMHRHCSYNLAIIGPDDRRRRIRLPAHRGTVDPNELFSRGVADECLDDPQPCRDYLTANAGSTDPAVVEGYVQRQFFLAIRECSNAFTLPVVALHNNSIGDTARYRARQGAVETTDVRRGTFDQAPRPSGSGAESNPSRPLQELRDWLTDSFDEETTTRLTGRAGTTNIFRWCVSPDISRCHVGDPDHPDTVVWVTNEADFERLSRESVNVVLQSQASATGESATDLSTLFLVLRELIEGRYAPVIEGLESGAEIEVDRIREILRELEQMRTYDDLTVDNTLSRLAEILEAFGGLLLRLLELALLFGERAVRLSRLRYLNIETPRSPTRAGQTREQLRLESYAAIVEVLRAVGLHCCGDDPAAGERRVREGLRRGTFEETD